MVSLVSFTILKNEREEAIRLSDLKSQLGALHNDLKVAVEKDPKALTGISTHTLLLDLAHQAKDEAQNKKAVETAITALHTPRGKFTIRDALNIADS